MPPLYYTLTARLDNLDEDGNTLPKELALPWALDIATRVITDQEQFQKWLAFAVSNPADTTGQFVMACAKK